MSTDAASNASTDIAVAVVPTHGRVAGESAIVLGGIEWSEYVALREKPANRGLRMTYAEGTLEIMTLSSFHELISIIIDHFILEWRVAREIPVQPTGSMTLRSQKIERGLEGDQSYYIRHEPNVRGLATIDLETSPPPDLATEVEHASRPISKMQIYAALRVPEVWRWHNETLTVYRLAQDTYEVQPHSEAFRDFPLDVLRDALSRRMSVNETALVAEFRRLIADRSQG